MTRRQFVVQGPAVAAMGLRGVAQMVLPAPVFAAEVKALQGAF
jgi:hypothetical protein